MDMQWLLNDDAHHD